jgi:hypothetical protein
VTSKKYSHDELAKLGIQVEQTPIEVLGRPAREIDLVSQDKHLSRIAREESFMNERVKIRVASPRRPIRTRRRTRS